MNVKSEETCRCGWGEDRTALEMEILCVGRRGQGKEKNEESRCACENERKV